MWFIAKASKCIFIILSTFSFLIECKKFQIVGGHFVNITDFPFQAAYYSGVRFVCSGSLLSPNFVLTAAHCTTQNPSRISVRLGSPFRNYGGRSIRVMKFFTHPNYNSMTYDFDFSLLKLASTVRYSATVQPAILPSENAIVPVGTECTASGWGLTNLNMPDPPEELLAAKIYITDFETCKKAYEGKSSFLTDRMICAGVDDGSRDSCLGDSGGPLVCNGVLYGVISFGYGCALKGYPGIYANVSYAVQWINTVAELN